MGLVRYLLLRFAAGVVGLMPLSLARRIGRWGGGIAAVFMGNARRMARRHMTRSGFEESEADAAVVEVFRNYGAYWTESMWMRPRRFREIIDTTILEGRDLVEEALAEHKGMILALPHMGNWEFAGPLGTLIGFRLVAVAERLKNRWIRDWFVDLRSRLGIEVLFAGDRETMRALEAVLNGNGAVALVCDRDLSRKGIEVEFFGEKTTFPAGPAMLALRTGAPIFPVASYMDKKGGHRVVVKPSVEIPQGLDRSATLSAVTQNLTREIEGLIKVHPEQWHLLQPNWPSDREEASP